jgi:hypothetical protein
MFQLNLQKLLGGFMLIEMAGNQEEIAPVAIIRARTMGHALKKEQRFVAK